MDDSGQEAVGVDSVLGEVPDDRLVLRFDSTI
jgi:hypothetical protein